MRGHVLSSAYIWFDDFAFEQSDEEERDETEHAIETLLLVQRNLQINVYILVHSGAFCRNQPAHSC